MGAARQPAQHIFCASNGQHPGLGGAVERRQEEKPAGLHEAAAGPQEQIDVRHVLHDLEGQNDVELCAAFGQRLGGALAIVDGEVLARSMDGRGRDVAGRGVHAGDRRAEPGHRLADQTAATADVEQRQSRQRFAVQGVALPVRSHPVADVGDPHRIQPV